MELIIELAVTLFLVINLAVLYIFIKSNIIIKKFISCPDDLKSNVKAQNVYKLYYQLLNKWLKKSIAGQKTAHYFKEQNVKNIAIYGQGELGMRLYEELSGSDIKVKFFITQNISKLSETSVPVVMVENLNEQERVDWIVVSPIYDFESIKNQIKHFGIANKIVSLEEVIN